ncbi:hypothetical protein LX64_01755 [Chitinophaga skermanii]|uniref:Uncharacterized protein n=1 Tax=Chitinophaga skermanii TaxID=331697 RepID=A0A327QRH2_9BACT|nr:DUF5682 family protein [Chitinophaga skermanii]RAJ06628.1 hypothetical protein LX64_01755 [Chitinophaga skermanii]
MIHILGIRHHGPGSARHVANFLSKVKPDIVLVEGPPEADELLQWVNHTDMQPPVALLLHQSDEPQKAVFYPFAEFSPEWQAMRYAREHNIHVRFMDLPVAHSFALDNEPATTAQEAEVEAVHGAAPTTAINELPNLDIPFKRNPMQHLASAAGFEDEEAWWEHMVEYRLDNTEVFEAIQEGVHALREDLPLPEVKRELLREAHMRKVIRQAEKEMFQNIAVICGAWHAPALSNMPKQKEDNDLLKGLPKVKIECTWIPWTYGRLSYDSGYGAGIPSPGWYEHNWKYPTDDGTRWMAKVASLFREKGMDTSVAHVMEAVRLADALAALRGLSRPGLEELNEATLSVLCNGDDIMMQLLHKELIVQDIIGQVPIDIPKPPLQLDIEKTQKRLRLPASADWKDYTFDLRKDTDLERSIFLHRLLLLGINWAHPTGVNSKGTFKESWRLQWDPNMTIEIIEKGSWGNTVESATSKYVVHLANTSATLPVICQLLEKALPAALHESVDVLMQQLNNLAAASGDVMQLMETIPTLVSISRYGNVRKTDAAMVSSLLQGMMTRICISLPQACTALNEEAANAMIDLFFGMNDAANTLQQADILAAWQATLQQVAHNLNSSPVIAGYATRLLSDYKILADETLVQHFHFAMSTATAPAVAAAWLEGFLRGSGTILLLDEALWSVVNNWVATLDEDTFLQVLPLLRRSFAHYTQPERRKLGEKAKSGPSTGKTVRMPSEETIDEARAMRGIPVVMQLLGLPLNTPGHAE